MRQRPVTILSPERVRTSCQSTRPASPFEAPPRPLTPHPAKDPVGIDLAAHRAVADAICAAQLVTRTAQHHRAVVIRDPYTPTSALRRELHRRVAVLRLARRGVRQVGERARLKRRAADRHLARERVVEHDRQQVGRRQDDGERPHERRLAARAQMRPVLEDEQQQRPDGQHEHEDERESRVADPQALASRRGHDIEMAQRLVVEPRRNAAGRRVALVQGIDRVERRGGLTTRLAVAHLHPLVVDRGKDVRLDPVPQLRLQLDGKRVVGTQHLRERGRFGVDRGLRVVELVDDGGDREREDQREHQLVHDPQSAGELLELLLGDVRGHPADDDREGDGKRDASADEDQHDLERRQGVQQGTHSGAILAMLASGVQSDAVVCLTTRGRARRARRHRGGARARGGPCG